MEMMQRRRRRLALAPRPRRHYLSSLVLLLLVLVSGQPVSSCISQPGAASAVGEEIVEDLEVFTEDDVLAVATDAGLPHGREVRVSDKDAGVS